jgi:hypothetical protein
MRENPESQRQEGSHAPSEAAPTSPSPAQRAPDFRGIDLGREELQLHGIPIEYWEALVLATVGKDGVFTLPGREHGREAGPWNPVVRGAIHLALRHLRERFGALARDLRGRLEESPLDLAVSHSERVIGFILASEEERALATLPRKSPAEGGPVDDQIARVSNDVRRALVASTDCPKPASGAAVGPLEVKALPPPSSPAPAAKAPVRPRVATPVVRAEGGKPGKTAAPKVTAGPPAAPPPGGAFPVWTETAIISFQEIPDPPQTSPSPAPLAKAVPETLLPGERELLDLAITPAEEKAAAPATRDRDMGLAEAWAHLYREGPSRIEMWEALTLLSVEGDPVRRSVEELLGSRAGGGPPLSADLPGELFKKILAVRWEWGGFAHRLRDFLAPLLEPSTDPAVLEMSFALLLSAPAGRERARRWLAQPEHSRSEATGYARTVVRLAERRRTGSLTES